MIFYLVLVGLEEIINFEPFNMSKIPSCIEKIGISGEKVRKLLVGFPNLTQLSQNTLKANLLMFSYLAKLLQNLIEQEESQDDFSNLKDLG